MIDLLTPVQSTEVLIILSTVLHTTFTKIRLNILLLKLPLLRLRLVESLNKSNFDCVQTEEVNFNHLKRINGLCFLLRFIRHLRY